MRAIPFGGERFNLSGCEVAGERLDLALFRRELEVHGGQTNRVKVAAIVLAAALLVGCGGSHRHRSATAIVRSWSAALDRNDNDAAAGLFADGAHVVQDNELVLHSHSDAVRWNASLPCGGKILRLAPQGDAQVLAVFRLKERPGHRCDGPGTMAAAIFRVSGGKIVLWHQTDVPPPEEGGTPI